MGLQQIGGKSGGGVALGETATTAYRGDRGKTAFDHSQATGNPHGATPADIGAATAAQGALADSALQSVPNDHVTNERLMDMPAGTLKGRQIGVPTGNPQDLTPTQARAVLGLATTDAPTFAGATFNGNVSYGAGDRTITGNIQRSGYEYWPGAGIGYGNLAGVQEFAVGASNRIRFNAGSTNVFVAGGACLSPMTNGIRVIDATSGDRDFQARDLVATQYLRPASYTVAVANALVSPPEGSHIYVSNESGGAIPAYRRGSSWRRYGDNAIIS